MDLYSGGGGSVLGGEDHLDVQVAVDFDPVSCRTLQLNHPRTTVYCNSVGALHQRAKQISKGVPVDDIFDKRDNYLPVQQRVRLTNLPEPGSIAVLTAGPPW